MRLQLSQAAVQMRYHLSANDLAKLNRLLVSLKENSTPDWAREKEPGVYEFFHAGFWIGYTPMMISGERVIVVGAVEPH